MRKQFWGFIVLMMSWPSLSFANPIAEPERKFCLNCLIEKKHVEDCHICIQQEEFGVALMVGCVIIVIIVSLLILLILNVKARKGKKGKTAQE